VWYSDLTDAPSAAATTPATNASKKVAWEVQQGHDAMSSSRRPGDLAQWTLDTVEQSKLRDPNPPDSQLFLKRAPLTVGADGTVTLTVEPNEIYTLTTLTTGKKGTKTIPPAGDFQLPWNQTFDDEKVSAPPAIWYDQMGAFEVQKSTTAGRGNVMRQVVPVWPACWGYSCSGPTTYFGPSSFTSGTSISFDLNLEDHAKFSIAAGVTFEAGSDGSWSLNKKKGTGTGLKVGAWSTIRLDLGTKSTAAYVGGKLVANSTDVAKGSFSIKASMDRYVFASIDNFAIKKMAD
jgi:hypothetical protein